MFMFVKYVPMKYGMMGEFGSNLYFLNHYGQIMICESMIIDDELFMIPKLINARTHLSLNYLRYHQVISKIQSSGTKKTRSTIREYWLIWPGFFGGEWISRLDFPVDLGDLFNGLVGKMHRKLCVCLLRIYTSKVKVAHVFVPGFPRPVALRFSPVREQKVSTKSPMVLARDGRAV